MIEFMRAALPYLVAAIAIEVLVIVAVGLWQMRPGRKR